MSGTAQTKLRFLLLASLCLSLALSVELHGTIVELGAHDVEGSVSVDARHANQKAHVEHSAVEMRSHCAACVLTPESRVPPFGLQDRPQPRPPMASPAPWGSPTPLNRAVAQSPSRAPPLL